MNTKIKNEIDDMSYIEMLSLWRNASMGHPMFKGKTGDYFSKVMQAKKNATSHKEQVRASKDVGWQTK